ncbi:MAG: hypothetical protein IJZ53_13940 [Tyzzerella sp.]|nr:hypothetical protein [Tyzzerella sp.]
MGKLFELKGHISMLYTKYSRYIDRVLRFLLALLTFTFINNNIGFSSVLGNPFMSIVLSLICTFLPTAMTVVFAMFAVLLHVFTVSFGMAIVSAALFLVMYALYLRYTPGKSLILLLVLIAYMFNMPVAVPIIFGLVGGPVCIVAISMGTLFYYMVDYVKSYATLIGTVAETGMMEQITAYAQQVLLNGKMWAAIVSFGLVLLIVYYLRQLAVDHAWKIAIVAGALSNMIVMAFANVIMEVPVDYVALIVGSIFAVIFALILEFFVFAVDYARTEYLQFEDDEYYYYVKAVPKMSVAVPEKTVKRIHERQETETQKIIEED